SPSNVTVTFSKPIQPASANVNTLIVMSASTGKSLQGAVTYTDANRTATFTPAPLRPFLSDNYTVTVKGAAANATTDTDNLTLDGNSDGKAGDDYTFTFSVAPKPPA